MNRRAMVDRLAEAELDSARFNARRTTTARDETVIRRITDDDFHRIADPTHPGSAYYNRAVCRRREALTEARLGSLPDTVMAVEVPPELLDPGTAAVLLKLGFQPSESRCYLTASAHVAASAKPAATIDPWPHERADDFMDLLAIEGVEFTPETRERKRPFYCTDEFMTFVSTNADGVACAWATMYRTGSTAFLANAFTRPEFRRQGHQTALLHARLHHAAALGLGDVFTDVEHGSQSHMNTDRVGFRTATITTIWART
jgi:GNAT superfamily N-acetyltransferase